MVDEVLAHGERGGNLEGDINWGVQLTLLVVVLVVVVAVVWVRGRKCLQVSLPVVVRQFDQGNLC